MNKKFILILLIIVFNLFLTATAFAQTSPGNQRIRDLQPNSRNSTSPTTRPPSSPPASTPPANTPVNFCDYLVGVSTTYGEFVYITVSDKYFDDYPEGYLTALKAQPNGSNLPDDPILAYRTLLKSFYYSGETRLPTQTVVKNQVNKAITSLGDSNRPQFPMMVLGVMFTGDKYTEVYPKGYSVENGLTQLGCSGAKPSLVIAFTPVIHLYSSDQEFTLNLPSTTTFINQPYSLTDGIKLRGGSSLYYEFAKIELLNNLKKPPLAIIKGKNLNHFLTSKLLPQLSLTSTELEQVISLDINPQLNNINQEQNYEVMVLQNQEVNLLLPLSINPTPDTTIRNLIIVKATANSELINNLDNYLISTPRVGTTMVENGFLLW